MKSPRFIEDKQLPGHFKEKPPFDLSIYKPYLPQTTYSKTWHVRLAELAYNPKVKGLIVNAMIAVNDIQTSHFLNWQLIQLMKQLEAGELSSSEYSAIGYAHLLGHRRWVHRMSSICTKNAIDLIRNKLAKEKHFKIIFEDPVVRQRHIEFKEAMKEHPHFVNNLRNSTGGHVDDDNQITQAMIDLAKRAPEHLSKQTVSNKIFEMRFGVGDDVLVALAVQEGFNLDIKDKDYVLDVEKMLAWYFRINAVLLNFLTDFILKASNRFNV